MVVGIEIIKHLISSYILSLVLEIIVGGIIYILLNIILLKKFSNYSIDNIKQILKN